MSITMKTAQANYEFNTTKIEINNQHHLGFISNHVMFEMGLSSQEFHVWVLLRAQYKAHFSMNPDVIKCYSCFNAWIMDKAGIKCKKTLRKVLESLTTKGLLFSVASNGGASFRIPLDPADNDYDKIHATILAFIGDSSIRTDNIIEKVSKKESAKKTVKKVEKPAEVTEEKKVETPQPKVEKAEQPVSAYDYTRFVNHIKNRFGSAITVEVDVDNKVFTVNTGNLTLKKEWNEGLAPHGWSVK